MGDGKNVSSPNVMRKTGYPHAKEWIWTLKPRHITKITQKNKKEKKKKKRARPIKLLEENIR